MRFSGQKMGKLQWASSITRLSTFKSKTMKLTKEQTAEKREELCKVLIAMNKQRAKVDNIKKDLADDFDKNGKQYRGGIVTATGVPYRKPRWDVTDKEKLEAEG